MYYYGLNADGTVKGYCNTKEVADFAGYTLESETEPNESGSLKPIEEKIKNLNDDYMEARNELARYYANAILDGDIDTQKDIKSELTELTEQYNANVDELLSEEE